MGVSRTAVAQNREQILDAAERLIRARGADAVSLVDLMAAAGLTRGGFYNHFASKDELVRLVMQRAMAAGYEDLERAIGASREANRDPVADQIEYYLSSGHRAAVEDGCPNAGFAAEAPRLSAAAQQEYGEGLARNLDRFTELFTGDGDSDDARATAVVMFSEMVGALLLSRAVEASHPELAAEIASSAERDLRSRQGSALP